MPNSEYTIKDLQSFHLDLAKWQRQIFGEHVSPLSCLYRLKEEVDEAINQSDDITEYADIFILLLAAIDRAGFNIFDLLLTAEMKHEINKRREWFLAEDGMCRHVEEV